jgi:hypothetical protein
LRTSKTEGQPNFVNPGVLLAGWAEIQLTPSSAVSSTSITSTSAETDSIKTALLTDKVGRKLGWDFSLGFQYRPLLTDNVIISAGFGTLIPAAGSIDIRKPTPTPCQITTLAKCRSRR